MVGAKTEEVEEEPRREDNLNDKEDVTSHLLQKAN